MTSNLSVSFSLFSLTFIVVLTLRQLALDIFLFSLSCLVYEQLEYCSF